MFEPDDWNSSSYHKIQGLKASGKNLPNKRDYLKGVKIEPKPGA